VDFRLASVLVVMVAASSRFHIAALSLATPRRRTVMRRIGMKVQHNPWPTPPWFQVVGVLEIGCNLAVSRTTPEQAIDRLITSPPPRCRK